MKQVQEQIITPIDYNKPITRENIDLMFYNSKFAKCREFLKSQFPNPQMFKELMDDPTTYAYMVLKHEGKPIRLYPYQDLIINDDHRFKIFRASNQIGKSYLLDIKAARNLLIDHGHSHNEIIISKSLPQSMFQMRRVKLLLKTAALVDWKEEKGSADSMSVITHDIKGDDGKIKYSNMLVCTPCTEAALGYDLHEMNLDEFEYWDVDIEYFFKQIAQPRTYSTKGNITIFSNPNGQDNFVADLEEQQLRNKQKKWHTYIFNYMDKPGNTYDEYLQLKEELSRQAFESTVAAVRTISSKNYFTPEEIEKSYDRGLRELDMVGRQSYFFLDVGAKHDQSVLVGGFVEPDIKNPEFKSIHIPIIHVYPVGYPLSRVFGVGSAEETDGWHHEKSVKEYLTEWSLLEAGEQDEAGNVTKAETRLSPIFGVDVTGNSGVMPLFEAIGIYPIDITFSGPGKSAMYQRFKYFMEKGLLHRKKSKEFEYQATHMIAKKGKRGYLTIHHEKEDDLDDVMDSVCGLIHLADAPEFIEPSLVII